MPPARLHRHRRLLQSRLRARISTACFRFDFVLLARRGSSTQVALDVVSDGPVGYASRSIRPGLSDSHEKNCFAGFLDRSCCMKRVRILDAAFSRTHCDFAKSSRTSQTSLAIRETPFKRSRILPNDPIEVGQTVVILIFFQSLVDMLIIFAEGCETDGRFQIRKMKGEEHREFLADASAFRHADRA